MGWNWQQKNWPNFTYDQSVIRGYEDALIYQSGLLFGAFTHLSEENKSQIKVEIITTEALKTSEIEGEYLNRDSLQSSILRQFGLHTDHRRIGQAERSISELMINLYRTYAEPLSDELLHHSHSILFGTQKNLEIGKYRSSNEPMQIISGPLHKPKIHYEAPPSSMVAKEMAQFIRWFNNSAPNGPTPLPALVRAAIAHLYFVLIHPFEDGNGRMARALAEKALAQSVGRPSLIALATTIEKDKKRYYSALESTNRTTNFTEWVIYFAKVILDAQLYTQLRIEFIIQKTQFYDKYRECFNDRQQKLLARMFREGPEGFTGGLSAGNYISITGTSKATATRDLHELHQEGALIKMGDKKSARYYLNLTKTLDIK